MSLTEADLTRFALDPTQFQDIKVLTQDRHTIIKKCIYLPDNQSIIVHSLPFNGFHTSNLLEFFQFLLYIRNLDSDHLLKFYGFASDIDRFYIAYFDDGFFTLNEKEYEKEKLLKSVGESIAILHHAEIPHLRIKPSSIFIDKDGNFRLGCMQPRPIIDLDEEDLYLPFYKITNLQCDMYFYGLLIIEILEGKTQAEVLETIWDFEEFPATSPLMELAGRCVGFDITKRPIYEVLVGDDFNFPNIPVCGDRCVHAFGEKLVHNRSVFACLIYATIILKNNPKKALELYMAPELENSAISLNNIGKLLLTKNYEEAVNYFIKSAKLDYAVGQQNTAMAYLKGIGVEVDHDKELEYLKLAADQGYVDGLCHYADRMSHRNLSVYRKYLRIAARKGEDRAFHMYTSLLEQRIGYCHDQREKYLDAGCLMKYPMSINNKATHAESFEIANELWLEAAKTGLRHAQFNIGVSKMIGRGCEVNLQEAAYWMKLAAEQHYPQAMFNYSLMLRDGIGVEKNEELAEEWCKRASKQRLEATIRSEFINKLIKSIMNTLPAE